MRAKEGKGRASGRWGVLYCRGVGNRAEGEREGGRERGAKGSEGEGEGGRSEEAKKRRSHTNGSTMIAAPSSRVHT